MRNKSRADSTTHRFVQPRKLDLYLRLRSLPLGRNNFAGYSERLKSKDADLEFLISIHAYHSSLAGGQQGMHLALLPCGPAALRAVYNDGSIHQ